MQMKWIGSWLGTMALCAVGTAAADASLAQYAGADRMDRIVAAAKKEGTLTLYTTIA